MFGLTPYNRRNSEITRRGDLFNVFEDFFHDSFLPTSFGGMQSIRADISETEKEYRIDAEIPGAKKEDIKLDLRDDVLTISVEHNEEVEEERDRYIRKERRHGSYSRSFYVDNVRNEEVSAKYVDGILSIRLPKQEGERKDRYKIDIQ
jgi:HSP20 family protein